MKYVLPVMAKSFEEIRSILKEYSQEDKFDCFEIRLDAIKDEINLKSLKKDWNKIKKLSSKPIIFTYRSKVEGGLGNMSVDKYNNLILKAIGNLDLEYIDIELFSCIDDAKAKMYINMCKKKGIKVILSRHEMLFAKDSRDIELLCMRMSYLGCYACKVVVYAHREEDATKLWEGAVNAHKNIERIIAIAAGEKGSWTREKAMELDMYFNYMKPVGSCRGDITDMGQTLEVEKSK